MRVSTCNNPPLPRRLSKRAQASRCRCQQTYDILAQTHVDPGPCDTPAVRDAGCLPFLHAQAQLHKNIHRTPHADSNACTLAPPPKHSSSTPTAASPWQSIPHDVNPPTAPLFCPFAPSPPTTPKSTTLQNTAHKAVVVPALPMGPSYIAMNTLLHKYPAMPPKTHLLLPLLPK